MSDPKLDAQVADHRQREIESRKAVDPSVVEQAFNAWVGAYGTWIGFAMLSNDDVILVAEGKDVGASSLSLDYAIRAAKRERAAQQHDDAYERLVAPDLEDDPDGRYEAEESIDAATVRRHVSWWTRAQWTTDDGQWQIKVTPAEGVRRPMMSSRAPVPARVLVEVYRVESTEEDTYRNRIPEASIVLAKTKHTAQRAVAFYELVAALHSEETFEVDEQEAQEELRKVARSERHHAGGTLRTTKETTDAISDALKSAQAATADTTAQQAAEIGHDGHTWGPGHPGYDEMGQ